MTTLDGQDDGHGHHHGEHRREGDGIAIDGGYQYRALTEGRPVQRYWHAAKLRLVDSLLGDLSPGTAVDLGCGSGVVANHLAAKGIQTTGVDANPAAVAFARRTFERPNLAFREGLVDELDLAPGSIDLIVIMEVLEHLHASQVLPLLRSARGLLAPGGRLLLTTPNYAGTWPVLEWILDHTSLVPHMHEDQHVSRWTRRTLGAALTGAGFRTERIGTYCTVAPFISPLGRSLADRAFDLELRFDLRFGNLLYALARPRGPEGTVTEKDGHAADGAGSHAHDHGHAHGHGHPTPPAPEGTEAWGEWVKDYYREIETYDWVAATDKVVGLETFFHRKRAGEARKLIARWADPARGRILDAGCGTGLLTRHLPAGSVGVDINPRNVELASRRLPAHEFLLADVEALPFPDGSFGTVLCTEVVEHIPFPDRALREFRRILAPGGVLIGMTPAKNPIWSLRFLSSSCPHSEPFHNNYTTAEVREMLTASGLAPTSVRYTFGRLSVAFVAERRP